MSERRKSKRIRERLELKLPVRVHCRETLDFEWVEVTRMLDVTPFGAGLTLKHPTEKGRLLHLTIPMPRQLRVFDHVEDQYRVWTLVRHVRSLGSPADKTQSFHVGVAFIGKRAPKSYAEKPWTRYEIAVSAAEMILAEDSDNMLAAVPYVSERLHTRHSIPVDMLVEILNEKGEVTLTESTVTENISRRGATLFTTLTISPGRFVRVTSEQYQTTAHAAVRSCSTGADGISRIHLEFIDKEWPL